MIKRICALTLSLFALAIPVLACGATPPTEQIPYATLVAGVPPFTMAVVSPTLIQMFSGANGQLLWKREFPAADHATALVVDGILYRSAPSAPLVTALQADDGTVLWQFGACSDDDANPAIMDGLVYVTCGLHDPHTPAWIAGETLYALDARTGHRRWSVPAAHLRAVLAPQLVIAQTPVGLEALRADSGAVVWTHTTPISADQASSHTFSFGVTAANNLIAYSPDGMTVEALDAANGHLHWRSAVPALGLQDTQDWSVAAITTSVVIAHSGHGVVVFDAGDGALRWQDLSGGTGPFLGSVVSDQGIVYAGRPITNPFGSKLSAFDATTGAVLWQRSDFEGPSAPDIPFLPCGPVVYMGASWGLVALRASNGKDLWHDIFGFVPPAAVASPLVIGAVDVPPNNSPNNRFNVYLLNARDGKKVWKVPSTFTLNNGIYSGHIQLLLISTAGQQQSCS